MPNPSPPHLRHRYLTELVSHDPESIQGQLHHTRCIYNALADVKPEVEATIKMGRKLVEAAAVPEPAATSDNIDTLKELFNVLGAQVTEARATLERALAVAESLMAKVGEVLVWLEEAEEELGEARGSNEAGLLEAKVSQMREMKVKVKELLGVKAEFVGLVSDPTLLGGLTELLATLEARWSKVKGLLEEELSESTEVEEVDLPELELNLESGEAEEAGREQGREQGRELQEFRAVFQEVSGWLDSAERRLEGERRRSEERQLEEQVEALRPKVASLGAMAVRVADTFSSQREDVHGEMASLGGRWEAVLASLLASPDLSLVEVEQIKTTISQMVIPSSTLTQATSLGEIMTLPDDEVMEEVEEVGKEEDVEKELREKLEERLEKMRDPERRGSREGTRSPPATLPKPRWYLESVQSRHSSPPVRQVPLLLSSPPPLHNSSPPEPLLPPTPLLQPACQVVEVNINYYLTQTNLTTD